MSMLTSLPHILPVEDYRPYGYNSAHNDYFMFEKQEHSTPTSIYSLNTKGILVSTGKSKGGVVRTALVNVPISKEETFCALILAQLEKITGNTESLQKKPFDERVGVYFGNTLTLETWLGSNEKGLNAYRVEGLPKGLIVGAFKPIDHNGFYVRMGAKVGFSFYDPKEHIQFRTV